jgi:hypothetical protein
MAIVVLFVSCEQYHQTVDQVENRFDYSTFEKFKNSSSLENIINIINQKNLVKTSSTLEINRDILKVVNTEMGTDIVLPDEFLTLSTTLEADSIYSIGLKNDWINDDDLIKTRVFADEIQTYGFTKAIKNYENKVLTLNLTQEEFSKEVFFLNFIKSLEHERPDLFKAELLYKGQNPWRCALSLIAFVATFSGLASCVFVLPCLLAYTLFVAASLAVGDHCFGAN